MFDGPKTHFFRRFFDVLEGIKEAKDTSTAVTWFWPHFAYSDMKTRKKRFLECLYMLVSVNIQSHMPHCMRKNIESFSFKFCSKRFCPQSLITVLGWESKLPTKLVLSQYFASSSLCQAITNLQIEFRRNLTSWRHCKSNIEQLYNHQYHKPVCNIFYECMWSNKAKANV